MITSIVALAQDLIVTTDSKKIEAKIIEISSDQVKYKEYDMPDGPTFVLSTKEISMIIFSSASFAGSATRATFFNFPSSFILCKPSILFNNLTIL